MLDAGNVTLSVRQDRLSGIGGAGLYSDGKFSFRPSATALWELQPNTLFRRAERMFNEFFSEHGGVSTPQVPDLSERSLSCSLKPYPSVYLPFEKRLNMIEDLAGRSDDPMMGGQAVIAIRSTAARTTVRATSGLKVDSPALVLATGRLGHLSPAHKPILANTKPRRIEVGVRLETPSSEFPLRDFPLLDPKLSGELAHGVSWRTFCSCRDGEVMSLPWRGSTLLSGRGDCRPTGRSNVGVLVRLSPESAAGLHVTDLPSRLLASRQGFRVRLFDERLLAQHLGNVFGPVAVFIQKSLVALLAATAATPRNTWTVHGPCLEGIGLYPDVAADLRLPGSPIVCAGDCTGIFRGLTAALISGFHAGLVLMQDGNEHG